MPASHARARSSIRSRSPPLRQPRAAHANAESESVTDGFVPGLRQIGAATVKLRDVPGRAATGGYILHSGLEKWQGSEEQAKGVHALASGAYPVLAKVPPPTFLKVLAAAEIGTGTALLVPF